MKTTETQGHLVLVIQWSSLTGLEVSEADARSAIRKVLNKKTGEKAGVKVPAAYAQGRPCVRRPRTHTKHVSNPCALQRQGNPRQKNPQGL